MDKSDKLQKYILSTLVYYDVLDYPMTAFEIWKYLTVIGGQDLPEEESFSLAEILEELAAEKLRKFIENKNGYYFLRGREDLVAQRIFRNKISERKFKIARRTVWFLRFVPFVRGVAVTGRLAAKNAENGSDIDFLIVLKEGKIFTGRLLATLLVHALGRRRHGAKIRDRICLNHFISDKFFISVKDIFSAHEYVFLAPVFGEASFDEFYANNDWIKKYKINFMPGGENLKAAADSAFSSRVRKFLEKIFTADSIEKSLKKWQQKRIAGNPKTQQAGAVIINDDLELSFWPNFENQGPKVFEKFQKRLSGLKQARRDD